MSTAVQPRRSARPLSGLGRLTEIVGSVDAPAPRSIQERVKPSGRVQGYRKKSGGALVGVSVDRSCPNTRQLTIGAPSRAPDGHACTAAASGTVRDFRGDWRDKHEAPSTSGLDGPVCSCVERGVHRGKTMYRCSGKCLTVNPYAICAIAMAVTAGPGDISDEGVRQRVLWVPASGLAFRGSCRARHSLAVLLSLGTHTHLGSTATGRCLPSEHLRMRS